MHGWFSFCAVVQFCAQSNTCCSSNQLSNVQLNRQQLGPFPATVIKLLIFGMIRIHFGYILHQAENLLKFFLS